MKPQIHKHKLVTIDKLGKDGKEAIPAPAKKRRFKVILSMMKELEEMHKISLFGIYKN